MAQVTRTKDITITEWWDNVYPYALTLEKSITTAPHDMAYWDVDSVNQTLPHILRNIQDLPYPHCAATMREALVRAITYLIHAYQELGNENEHEVDFYYSSALTQVAQLHHQLVKHGFAN